MAQTAAEPSIDRTLSPAARAALAAGVPDSTSRAYSRDLQDFTEWCESVGRCAMPATAETLTEYAAHLAYAKHRAPSSIERARSAIRTAHRTAQLQPPDSLGLATVLKGYKRSLSETKDPKATPRRASAATKKPLKAMVSKLDRDTTAGRRDAALILMAFATAGRISELEPINIEEVTLTDEGLKVRIYRRKTHKHQEVAVKPANDPELCPVIAFTEWLDDLARHGRATGPLFVRVNRHGHVGAPVRRGGVVIGDPSGRMTAQAIAQLVERAAKRAGLVGKWTGHSTRRGFATESRKAGHDQIRIARHGGWADDSPVLAGYIEDADQWEENALDGVL